MGKGRGSHLPAEQPPGGWRTHFTGTMLWKATLGLDADSLSGQIHIQFDQAGKSSWLDLQITKAAG